MEALKKGNVLLSIMPDGSIGILPLSINSKALVQEQLNGYNYLLTGYDTTVREINEVSESLNDE